MAHNTRIRADVAAWGVGTVVTPDEFDTLDRGQYTAINGDDGGVWSPVAYIGIGGQGVRLSGANHQITGTATVMSGGYVTVASGGHLDLSSGAAMAISAGANIGMSGTLNVSPTGTQTVDGILNPRSGSTLKLEGSATLEATGSIELKVNSTFTAKTPIVLTNGGRLRLRVGTGTDSNNIYSPTGYDVIVIPSLTAVRTYALDATGCASGDTITFSVARAVSASYYVQFTGSGDASGLAVGNASSMPSQITFILDGANWYVLHSSDKN
jgi:hypothetical protein